MPYEPLPGHLFHMGTQFSCPCGNSGFKVEIGVEPPRFWCDCGAVYTEAIVAALEESKKVEGDVV